MHNFYLCSAVPARPIGRKYRVLAHLPSLFKVPAEFVPLPDPLTQMTTPEQRINLWHLVEQVLAYRVPGGFVDLGCFDGQTSALIAGILARLEPSRPFHLYDSFENPLGHRGDVRAALLARFQAQGLPAPLLHVGRFESTLPGELPATIAFAQLDCGVGGPPDLHAELIEFCLGHVWPRLSPGAVCVVQDYFDPENPQASHNYYPHVKPTVDRFLARHGVEATALVSGKYSHGFFRKPLG